MGSVVFRPPGPGRGILPEIYEASPDAVGRPHLAGFGDASILALCAVLYVVWTNSREGPTIQGSLRENVGWRHYTAPRFPVASSRLLVVLHRLALTA